MSVNWGMMAQTGQALNEGLGAVGAQIKDYRERQAANELIAKLGLGQQQPAIAQMGQPQTLAALGSQMPQPIAQQNPGNATTSQIGQIAPANRPIAQGFANEMGQKWAQQPQRGPSQAMAYSGNGIDASGRAISGIESGGRYDALGPTIPKTGDRAFGKYQVMGANVPSWTEKYLGRALSPQEFLANPQAQEAVFQGEFGRLSQKYGPEGAARAWFAGEGGMNDQNRKDVLGTSVAGYANKFVAGGGVPQQQGNPLANAAPMQGGQPQQPMTLAQLSGPAQQPQLDMQTLSALMTNKYTAPIGQALISRQLGRDPMQMALQQEQLRAAQLGNQRTQAEMAGDGAKLQQIDMGDSIGFVNQKGELVRSIQKNISQKPVIVPEGATLANPVTGQPVMSGTPKPGEFQKTLDKKNADMFSGLLDQSAQIQSDIADIGKLKELLPNTPVGLQAKAARFGNSLGLGGASGANVQEFDAIVNRLVPAQRPAGSGTMSDRDVELFKSALPSLAGTADGNKRIIATMEGMARYKQAQAEIANRVATGQMSPTDGIKALGAVPNPLEWVRGQNKAATPANPNQTAVPKLRAQDKAAFDALPSGTRFVDPNGVERIKP